MFKKFKDDFIFLGLVIGIPALYYIWISGLVEMVVTLLLYAIGAFVAYIMVLGLFHDFADLVAKKTVALKNKDH